MASITGNGSKGHHKFILTVTQSSQNVANNTSTVSYKFQIAPVQTSWNWEQWGAYIKYSFKINGVEYTGSIDSYDGSSTVTLKSGTQTITHNSDGTKSISYSFSVTDTSGVSYTSGNASASGTLALSTIARATTPTLSATNVTANGSNAINITINPASSTFKHKVRYDFGSLTGQSSGMSIGSDFTPMGNVTISFTPPSSLCNQIPNAKSGVLTIKLYTYTSAGVHIGTKSVTMTLTVPTYTLKFNEVTLTGRNLLAGVYVEGKSTVDVWADISSSYGAEICDVAATLDGKTYNTNMFTSSVLSKGSKVLQITIKDTRGYTLSYAAAPFTVYEYKTPTITSFTLTRQSDGTTVDAVVKGSISAVNNKNTKSVSVTLNGVTKTITPGAYAIDDSITFTDVPTDSTFTGKVTIEDVYNSVSKESVLPTVEVTMDFHYSGKGAAFGKVAEWEDFLDLNWNLYCRKFVSINSSSFGPLTINRIGAAEGATIKFVNSNGTLGFIGMSGTADTGIRRWTANSAGAYFVLDTGNLTNHIKDYIVEQGTNGIWTYRKWNSGVAECWGNVSTTPTTVNGNNAVSVNLPFTFVGTDYKVNISPAKAAMYITAFGDCATNGTITHTTTSFTMAYKYSYGTAYAVSFNVNVYGKWK